MIFCLSGSKNGFAYLKKQYRINLEFCTQFKNNENNFVRISNKIKYIIKVFNLSFLNNHSYFFIMCLVFYICSLQ